LNILRIHPKRVGNFLGRIFRVERELKAYFVSPIKSTRGSIVTEIETVGNLATGGGGTSVDGDLEIAGVAGEDFAVALDEDRIGK
jgi:hypothetical protein